MVPLQRERNLAFLLMFGIKKRNVSQVKFFIDILLDLITIKMDELNKSFVKEGVNGEEKFKYEVREVEGN